jgi:RNA polymerase sigma-70 factor (ECF subfamily)
MSGEELIRACAEADDSAAWDEFVSRFHRPISLSIIRTAYQWGEIPQQVVDDLVQETYLKLCANKCRQLLEFATQHPDAILGYIKTIAINVTHDYFKGLHSQKRGSGEIEQIAEESDPKAAAGAVGGPEAIEREVLMSQINEHVEWCCGQGPDHDRDRTMFWLHHQHGMTAKDIAALPTIGLSESGVESAISRLIRCVRERVAVAH